MHPAGRQRQSHCNDRLYETVFTYTVIRTLRTLMRRLRARVHFLYAFSYVCRVALLFHAAVVEHNKQDPPLQLHSNIAGPKVSASWKLMRMNPDK